MIRRPPSSTLTGTRLPYTTLFRSAHVAVVRARMLAQNVVATLQNNAITRTATSPGWAVLALLCLRLSLKLLLLLLHPFNRSAEHTSELQSLMRISYAVFCLKKKTK